MMKVFRYSFCFALIFTISLVMMISGSTVALGYEGLGIAGNVNSELNIVEINGKTGKTNEDVTFFVTAPNGNIVSIDQVSPNSNGYFATKIGVGGPLWKQDGTYTITAQQGTKYSFIDSIQIRVIDGALGVQFDKNVKNSDDCKLKTPPRWDKTAEKDEQFSISWDNPDTSICKYYVVMYDQNKNKSERTSGQWTDRISGIDITQSWGEQSYFKICNANENWCTKFIDVNVIDPEKNNFLILLGIVFGMLVTGISILFMIKKKGSKKSPIPSPTEESTEESTDIDKQIAINEEKIRKIEEESKRLDEED